MPSHEINQSAKVSPIKAKILQGERSSSSSSLSSSSSVSSASLSTLSLTNTNESTTNLETPKIQSSNYNHNYNYYINQFRPSTNSILKPGSLFVGSQQSGRSTYEVEVELKSVDLNNSTLSGYLKIQGLTESHPEIITFFEGEIISSKYSFFTDDKTWGSTDEIDIQHWSKFPNWKKSLPIKKILNKDYIHNDYLSHENIYMRWKERFLVPDSKVDNIEGASFAGFYYISFNQRTGDVNGLYYHKSSEKFQQLELCHVDSFGIGGSYQFQ